MKAKIDVTIKYTIFQEVDSPVDIIDSHEVADVACQEVCDYFTKYRAVTTYEIVESTLDARA